MKKGLKNYLYQTAYQLLIVLTPLLTAPCLARALGTEGIGIYSYTANFANYFLMFAMLGMANYGARYIAQNRDDKQKLSYSFYSIYFCQCICTGLMIVLYTIYLLTICNVNLLASILQVMLIFSGFFDVCWFFRGIEDFQTIIKRNIVIKLAIVASILLFVKCPDDLLLYIIIMSGGTLLSQFLIFTQVRKVVDFVKPSWKDVFSHLLPNFVLFLPEITSSLYNSIKKRNRDIIYKAVKDADVIIIRSLGTFVTNSTFKIANKLNKPIITEVTGPIFEGNYYGGFFSRMLAVSREWSAKKLNSVAKYTLYVTKNALQERYPNAGIMVGISDVYLPEVDIKKIVEKRSRKNNAEKVVFGTAGSTSLPRKGHKYVIKALGILKREGITNIEYHMAGGGDEADIIKQAKKENVLEMIHFDGTIPASEMSTFYDNIDVYLSSARISRKSSKRSLVIALPPSAPHTM